MKNISFICIGSNKVIGDSLGPLVGSFLKEKYRSNDNIKIYGDINNPVTFKNIEYIKNKISKSETVVLIDSALGKDVGNIIINKGGINIGESLDKDKNVNGDISIKGVVGLDYKNCLYNFLELKNVNENIIYMLANNIVSIIDV